MANPYYVYGRKGEDHPKAKLTEGLVRQAWELKAKGMTRAEIAARFGVSKAAISDVFAGRNWKHVVPEVDPPR